MIISLLNKPVYPFYTPLYNFIDDSYFAKIIIDMLLCKVANADKSSTICGRTNIAHFEDIFINFFVRKFSFLFLIIHALKPPRFLVCDDLRKIFCKINPIKAKKEIGTMYYVPDESREKAVHPRQNGSLFR